MSEKDERAGLGKVIYDVDQKEHEERTRSEEQEEVAEVEEADVESFPASDPPSFAGGSTDDSSQAAT